MNMRQSHTAVVERNQIWEDDFVTEPYEAGWSHEAIFFVRILRAEENPIVEAKVQISPDGIHWCDEGSRMNFVVQQHTLDKPSFVRVSHYGGWLRLAGTVKHGRVWALVHLALKA
ncbi:MAG: hypothetical protein J4F35_12570 [Candidatus Latescibacteria bacterium]|nr:hypothetical protein [Candidatus Latescibacterota bacterium]